MQEYGLYLLMLVDNRQQQDRRIEALKLTLVGHDPAYWVKRLFPELVGASPPSTNGKVEGEPVKKDEDLKDTEGAWQFTDTPTAEEAQKIMAEMMANPIGTLSALELEDIDDLEGWS